MNGHFKNYDSGNDSGDDIVEPDSTTPDIGLSVLKVETIEDVDRIIDEGSFDLPKSLIITNLDVRIFNENSTERIQFEDAFHQLDSVAKFLYFKSFRRARIDFSMPQAAAKARIICDQMKFGDECIKCYYAEICEKVSKSALLQPPALEKQFLISPPASPPEGWAPCEEAQPCLNIDLQSALANLIPGSAHELHPASDNHPGIVVHTCSETNNTPKLEIDDTHVVTSAGIFDDLDQIQPKMKIQHTACPPSMMMKNPSANQ